MKINNMYLYKSKISNKIFQNCEFFGNNIMIETVSGKKISGIKYKNLSIYYAKKLLSHGIKKNDNVVVFVKDIVDFSAYALAVLLVGARLIIVESDYSEKILEEKLKFINPDLVIIEGILYSFLQIPFLNKLNKIKKYESLLKYSKKTITNINVFNKKDINIGFKEDKGDRESIVVFTGGTTGNPKGVVHTIDSLEVMFHRIQEIIGNKSEIFYADLPHFVLIGISMGVKVIAGKNDVGDIEFLNILNKFKIDTTFSPPYRYLNIVNGNCILPDTLKKICLGSAPIYKSFLNKIYHKVSINTQITCIYGMTELLPISYVDGREKLDKNISGDFLGEPFDNIHINILNDGELQIFGKGLFKKYLGGDIIKKHNTGDLVEYIDGKLIMKGRSKDMILRKDYNIYPSLYEPIINSIDGIIESALVGVYIDSLEDEKIILFIESKNITQENIFKQLIKGEFSIDLFAIPDEIIFCNIPRKGRQNKIDKNYLRSNYENIGK